MKEDFKKIKKTFLNIQIPSVLKEELRKEGAHKGRSLSNYVFWLLKNRNKPQKKATGANFFTENKVRIIESETD